MRRPLLLLLAVTTVCAIHRPSTKTEDKTKSDVAAQKAEEAPPQLPILTKAQKYALITQNGKGKQLTRRILRRVRREKKVKRDLLLTPWRITQALKRRKPRPTKRRPVALPVDVCPSKFDAATRAYNGRSYVFAGERVYQMWFEDGLQQKASYLITELFPGGPRGVTAALTNSRSGVTILFSHRTAYRFRWNRKWKKFQLARDTPKELPRNITMTPQTAFEWTDGNQVVLTGDQFIIYDAYWNMATFTGQTGRYFPNLPRDILGIVHTGGHTILIFTKNNTLKVYSTKKYRVVQEYPLKINEYVGCLNS